jgi:hypothetical protein
VVADEEEEALGLELDAPLADSSFLAAGGVDEAPPLADELDAPGLAGGVDEAPPLAEELDELGLVDDGDDEAPPLEPTEAEPDAEPLGEDGEVLLGADEVLELDEPGVDEVLFRSPLSQAARPKASATAAAKIESFMCPPWVGI